MTKAKAPPPGEEQRQRRMSLALLLKHSCVVDVLTCPACGGRRKLVAVIEHKPRVQKSLGHVGLESAPPTFAAARGPPLFAGLEDSTPDDRR